MKTCQNVLQNFDAVSRSEVVHRYQRSCKDSGTAFVGSNDE